MNATLSDFLIDTSKANEEKLAQLVKPYLLGIDQNTGQPYFKPIFAQLSSKSKILCLLLSLKISFLLKKLKKEGTSWSNITTVLGMPGGTVRSTLFNLRQEGFVTQDGAGDYFIPNQALLNLDLSSEQNDNTPPIKEEVKPVITKKYQKKTAAPVSSPTTINISRGKWEPYFNHLSKQGKYLERSLLVLKIAKDDGIDGLTPKQIELFLREVIRAPIASKNISFFLGKNPSYTDRKKETTGKGYIYRIMKLGEDLVEKYINSK